MKPHSTQGAKTPLEVIATGTARWFCCIYSISGMKFMKGLCLLVFSAGNDGYGTHSFDNNTGNKLDLGKSRDDHPIGLWNRIDHNRCIQYKIYLICLF